MSIKKRLTESQRKKEIIDSAIKVIIAKGFEKTTMEEIIAGTTLSKGGVYHYYGSVLEIFKDIMISGIEYRNSVIKKHLNEAKKSISNEFIAKEMVSKMIDDNPLMPIYIEFLIAKKRNPELQDLMFELQVQSKERFKAMNSKFSSVIEDSNIFQFITHFTNAIILGTDILDARENFTANRQILEQMIVTLLEMIVKNESNLN